MEQILKPLHLACVADDLRPNMRLIQIKNGIAHASEGHMLVKLQLKETSILTDEQIDLLNDKFIDMEVWKECHKCDELEITDTNLIVYKNGIKKIFEFAQSQGTFFNIDSIIETIKAKNPTSLPGICLNPKFIEILNKIFQESQLEFTFSEGRGSGVLVTPREHSGMFALLMPMDKESYNRYFFLT